MSSVILILVVATLCYLWIRASRLNRRKWLERLDLPGTWIWEDHDGVLELEGELDAGHYRIRDDDQEEQGEWHLRGHDLVLEPRTGPPTSLDLRMFTEGKIGIHGPGRERRVYIKKRGNVIPMRRPA